MSWWRKPSEPPIPLGTYGFRRRLHLVGDETQSHIHVMGKSGSGKSRWLAAFYVNLIKAGYSATLIDPHGDLARLVMARLVADGFFAQPESFQRLHYLDIPKAASRGRYLRFNCLAQPYDTHTTTELVLDALRRAFPELDGGVAPAFEQMVMASVHVLIENGLPFSELRNVLLRKEWRDRLLRNVDDELVTSFFLEEYDQWDDRERMTLRGSTMRRLFKILYSPVLRHALAAAENVVEYRTILDRNRSLIVNLAIQQPDTKRLFGCLFTVFAEQGALARAALPAGERFGTHYLILDEFQLFVSQSAAALTNMLSQTRKFRLFTVLSHQTRDQIPERLQGALQNVEVDVTFRSGRQDAEHQAKVVGQVDPLAVKHEVEEGTERSHPAFFSLQEQWEAWTTEVVKLKKRSAFVNHPDGRVIKVKSPPMPDPAVDPDRLAEVEEHYLGDCFRPARTLAVPADDSPDVVANGSAGQRVYRRGYAD